MNDGRKPAGPEGLSTVAHERPKGSLAQSAFDFEIVAGPDAGRKFTLDVSTPLRVLVGQSPVCDVILTDRSVSRRHISLEQSERGVRLTDLESTNGTFVENLAVVQMYLHGGEKVRIGDTSFTVTARKDDHEEPPAARGFGRIVGASYEMRRLYPTFARLAQSNVAVLIEGASGTGKDLLAECLHEQGPRAAGPLVVVDCAAGLKVAEAEIFGAEATATSPGRKGALEQAQGGTLILDDVGDLDLALQAKLFRALESKELRRSASSAPIALDVRIISTTRRDLDEDVLVGRMREDLFKLLAGARVELPQLRTRSGDVAVLVQHFANALGADDAMIASRVMRKLRGWEQDRWPGNVRELKNAIARQLALGDLDDAAARGAAAPGSNDSITRILEQKLPFTRAREQILEEFRRRYIEQVLAEHGGNVMRAAAASGIGRRYFQRIKARQRDS